MRRLREIIRNWFTYEPKLLKNIKEYDKKAAPRKTGGGGGYPINPKLGGRDVGGRKAPWRKRKILE